MITLANKPRFILRCIVNDGVLRGYKVYTARRVIGVVPPTFYRHSFAGYLWLDKTPSFQAVA